jgi:hypothetical protein
MHSSSISRAGVLLAASALLNVLSCGSLLPGSENKDTQNTLLALLAVASTGCASYADTAVSNSLFTGGTRTLYQVSSCDAAGWSRLGFTSDGTTQTATGKTVSDSPFAAYGTNVEVTFTVTSASGTLDVSAYAAGAFPGTSTTTPTVRIVAGSSCSVQHRSSSTGNLANVSTCTDTTTLSAGQTYTYCIDFDRGTTSSGSYTFGNMLAVWSKACSDVSLSERDQMADVKLMQMMNIPSMNPASSTKIGFSQNGIALQSFRVGNVVYSSSM